MNSIHFGPVEITPVINAQSELHSIGAVRCHQTPLRNEQIRFLPWFDTFAGDVFGKYRFCNLQQTGEGVTLHLKALSSNDYPFREKRDTSGDLCFRDVCWDAPAKEVDFRIQFRPASDTVDGHTFEGFKYWFEGDSPEVKCHRIVDRQTWEIGGAIDGNTQVLRSWLTPARCPMSKGEAYSTAGFEHVIGCMPGNLWARWTLLPSFDLQRGREGRGVLLNYFDEVSLIRTVVEKNVGDDHLRFWDLHLFEETHSFRTNPKTILHCPDTLDNVDLMNLWTRVHDRERDKARRQFGIEKDGPPQISLCKNVWVQIKFDESYRDVIDLAAELNADNVMIDPIWESGQTQIDEIERLQLKDKEVGGVLAKLTLSSQCEVIDLEVDKLRGGEEGLKKVCDEARAKGINILSWIAAHLSSRSAWNHGHTNKGQGHGTFGVFAAKESGSHPDTGYASACWALNLNAPVTDYLIARIKEISAKTGLKGFLWDSFSNLGWWQLDYSKGDKKPQFAQMARIYAELANEGLYLMPEAITTFSSHSCLGMYGLDAYQGEDLGYSYDSCVHPPVKEGTHEFIDNDILRGKLPVTYLFECVAHKRVPNMACWQVPAQERDPQALARMRDVFSVYKKIRDVMDVRTVLKNGEGVRWSSRDGGLHHLFAFREQMAPANAEDIISGEKIPAGGKLPAHRVYRLA